MKRFLFKMQSRFFHFLICALFFPGPIRLLFSQTVTWEQTNGPYGGSVQALFQTSAGDVLSGTALGGVFRYDDNDSTWTYLGLSDELIWAFAEAPGGILYAGVTGGVFRSTDSGRAWQHVLVLDAPVCALLATPAGDLFAGSHLQDYPARDGRLFRSRDGGQSWQRSESGLKGIGVSALLAAEDGSLFAGTWSETDYGAGIFRSLDGGDTWQESGLIGTAVFALVAGSADRLLAATDQGVFVSTDTGRTWQALGEGSPVKGARSIVELPGGELLTCAYSSVAGRLGFGVFRWNGEMWEQFNRGLPRFGAQTLLRTQSDAILAGTEIKGVFRLNEKEGSWEQLNHGLIASKVTALTESASGVIFAGTLLDGIYRSRDGGATWEHTANTDGYINVLAADAEGAVYAGTSAFGGVQRTTDSGDTWERLGLDSTITNDLLVLPAGDVLAATFHGLYRWQAGSKRWERVAFPQQVVRGLHRDAFGRLYATIPGGRGRLLVASDDGGITWEQVFNEPVYWITLTSNSLGHLFAGTSYERGVLRSTDHGRSWQETGLADSTLFVYTVVVDANDWIYAATNKGLYLSVDNGESWQAASTGLLKQKAIALMISLEGYLYAATPAGGVFRTRTPVAEFRTIDFALEQNYPNPFNATTTFRFSLPRSAHVTLHIYNMLGQEVAVPLSAERLKGENEVRWHAGHLASGIYLYRLVVNGYSATRRFVLIR